MPLRLDQERISQRFLAGPINICTLMPMRSIPFKVVCLLGMNDGVYHIDRPGKEALADTLLIEAQGQFVPQKRKRDRFVIVGVHPLIDYRLPLCFNLNSHYNEAIPLSLLRDELTLRLDQERISQRFLAGPINICTLMPMRSIPFTRKR